MASAQPNRVVFAERFVNILPEIRLTSRRSEAHKIARGHAAIALNDILGLSQSVPLRQQNSDALEIDEGDASKVGARPKLFSPPLASMGHRINDVVDPVTVGERGHLLGVVRHIGELPSVADVGIKIH
jgi:hypothetical protein